MTDNCNDQKIMINTISGGIVNFGGAFKIAPVSVSKSTSGSNPSTASATGLSSAASVGSSLFNIGGTTG